MKQFGQTAFIVGYLVFFSGCSGQANPPQDQKAQALVNSLSANCGSKSCPCSSPIGLIASGSEVTAYTSATVSCGQACRSVAVSLKCNDGKFDKDISSLQFSCSVDVCPACVLGDNLIAEGTNITTYNQSVVDCGDTCSDHQTSRLCSSGTLSGDATYDQVNCQPAFCACELPDKTGFLTLGGSMTFYSTNKPACGTSCTSLSQNRTCVSKGSGSSRTFSWSGDTKYSFGTCTEPDPATCVCKLGNGLPTLGNGGFVTLSSVAKSSCIPCSNHPSRNIKCVDGKLYDADSGAVVTNTQPYIYQCQQTECLACSIPNYGTLDDGSSITLFSQNSMSCAEDPKSFTYTLSCSKKNLSVNGKSYDPLTMVLPKVWYTSMSSTCVGCKTAWGVIFPVGTQITAFKTGSSVFGGSCGQPCSSQEMTCLPSGSFTGDPSYNLQACPQTCNQEGGGAPPRGCLLPWQNSFVTPGTKIPMWKKKIVGCGDSCFNHFKVGVCQIETGTFDAGFSYIYPACTEVCPK